MRCVRYDETGSAASSMSTCRSRDMTGFSVPTRTDLATRPAPDEWSIAELIGHLIETDGVFRSRVTAVLDSDGVPVLGSCRPWTLHEGKGHEHMSADALRSAFRATRAETIALVDGLTDADWIRKGTVRGTANSVLDFGSWLANHDVGHLAQARR
jgi:DinB superfamily